MTIPVLTFCLTRSPYSFSLFGTLAPPLYILYRITKHLFPLSENDTKIALAKQQRKNAVIPKHQQTLVYP
jgi:hypothetical protein